MAHTLSAKGSFLHFIHFSSLLNIFLKVWVCVCVWSGIIITNIHFCYQNEHIRNSVIALDGTLINNNDSNKPHEYIQAQQHQGEEVMVMVGRGSSGDGSPNINQRESWVRQGLRWSRPSQDQHTSRDKASEFDLDESCSLSNSLYELRNKNKNTKHYKFDFNFNLNYKSC